MSRPVYIPSRKRKQKQPRFHGAFTGGFSAGHFNTVADGSAEGFVPKQEEREIRRQQKPQDFMDDQDHNEWGGPTSVKEEYAMAASNSNETLPAAGKSNTIGNAMIDLVKAPAQNVGHRLLRILGWRDGSTAYVPREEDETVLLTNTTTGDASIESLLSSRRLKRIQLQQARVKLPAPKLDTCGLGYDSYENAPEFRAHKERRRKEAQQRAKAVTASSADNRNVYRLSNLLDDNNDDTRQSHTKNHHEEDDDPLASYETEQSFIGTKTVGGFALREDDDDVYDDHVKASKSNRDEYDTVVYEHASDDENDHDTKKNETGQDLGSVFASWATSRGDEKKSSRGVTSDGRPPLAGFVLGASTTSTKTMERYPGPDLPSNYEPKRHEFRNDEYPGELKEETKALQKSLLDERRKTIQQERKAEIRKMETKRESGPMANAAFAGLAVAMKNRFTPSAPDPPATLNGKPAPVGLHHPSKDPANTPCSPEPVPTAKAITITRTTMTFVPESLLCKRLHVRAPAHAKPTVGGKSVAELKGEAAYFEKEIMSKATVSDSSGVSKAKKPESTKKATAFALTQDLFENDGETEVNDSEKRPSMKVLESIFEPDSESSDLDEEVETSKAVPTDLSDQVNGASSHGLATATTPPGIPESTFTPQEAVQEDSGRKVEIAKEGRKRKQKSRSRSPRTSSNSDRSERKRSRKREEKKKRKKRHKSSRRRSRDK